ncbi:MAG: hypothetical protein ACI8YQ_002114 [Polaribacter sp.]|jgi:hypothetical protein
MEFIPFLQPISERTPQKTANPKHALNIKTIRNAKYL